MEREFRAFVKRPTRTTYLAVRQAMLLEEPQGVAAADIRKLQRWLKQGNIDALNWGIGQLPSSAALSPRVHFLAAQGAVATGDRETLELEHLLFQTCLQGLLATGDGSSQNPYLICQPCDEYDVLLTLGLKPVRQSLCEVDSQVLDLVECRGNRQIWFSAGEFSPKAALASRLPAVWQRLRSDYSTENLHSAASTSTSVLPQAKRFRRPGKSNQTPR